MSAKSFFERWKATRKGPSTQVEHLAQMTSDELISQNASLTAKVDGLRAELKAVKARLDVIHALVANGGQR